MHRTMTDDRDHVDAAPFPEVVTLHPIGVVRSPYRQRHGTPRQPGFQSDREHGTGAGTVELFPHRVAEAALDDLDGFERVWLISLFHLNGSRVRPRVRPPRGGPLRGVLATRSPHRPNGLGLSAVRLVGVRGLVLDVEDLDLIDGTPILDVKPYVPDFDAFPEASRGWLDGLRADDGAPTG